jgi:hypothetical protein
MVLLLFVFQATKSPVRKCILSIVSISAGVPQGLIFGPLLFLVYVNDIVNDISSNIKLFADDTSLYIVVDNPLTSFNLVLTQS